MSNRTPVLGRISDGTPFTFTCPEESYINEFYGYESKYPLDQSKTGINSIGAKCSDGTDLGRRGGSGDSEYSPKEWNITNSKPLTNFTGGHVIFKWDNKSRARVVKFMGQGTTNSSEWNERCPNGVATGIFGNANDREINAIGIQCGPPPAKYCIDNLEEAICKGVDADTLNKACSKNFTETCKDKKDLLTSSVINKYCKKNPTDDVCTGDTTYTSEEGGETDETTSSSSAGGILLLIIAVILGGGAILFAFRDTKKDKSIGNKQTNQLAYNQQSYNQQPTQQSYNQQPTQQSYNQQPTQQYYQQPNQQPYYQQPTQPYYQQPQAQPYYQPPPRG